MAFLRKITQFPFVPICITSGLCFFIILGFRSMGSLEHLELTAYDGLIRLRPRLEVKAPRILIITISENDIQQQGRWPLTDKTLAKALQTLVAQQPRAIGLDIFRDIQVPPGSAELDEVLRSNANIICVTKFGNSGVPPPPVLEGTGQVGFNDMLVDPGGVIRRGLLFLDNGEQVFYSFNLLLALYYLQKDGITAQADDLNPEYLKLGETTIQPLEHNDGAYVNADARGYQYLIDFKDANSFYRARSLTELLSGQIDPTDIQDKLVLVGVVAQSVKDFFYTPFSRGFQAEQQLAGVTVHAHLSSQLIRFGLNESRPIKTIKDSREIVLFLMFCLAGGIIGFFIRSLFRFTILIAAGLLFVFSFSFTAFLNGWWLPVVPTTLCLFLSTGMTTAYVSTREKQQRALLMNLFSKHVSKEVADTIWKKRDQFLHDGRPRPQKMTASILFSDIRGFTTISESLDPQVLIHWLNSYMETMTNIIMKHNGVVDDYAGDGIKANFGVPFPSTTEEEIKKDAVNAVNCAIAMGEATESINKHWLEQGLPPIDGTRIGIYTGSIVTGALGSSQRMKFTTVGDIVNIAARLESYDKDLARNNPWRVLIGEATYNHLNGQFNTHMVGKSDLKGKDEKITIYRVLSKKETSIKSMEKEDTI